MWGLAGAIKALTGQKPKADDAVLSPAVLAGLSAPALRGDTSGRLDPLNMSGESLLQAMDADAREALIAALVRAVISQTAQVERLPLRVARRDMQFETSILPLPQDKALVLVRDITLEFNLRAALVESRQRYKDLIEISSDFAWEINGQGNFAFVSPKGALGYSAEQLVGHNPVEFLPGGIDDPALALFLPDQVVEETEILMRRADGHLASLMIAALPMIDPDGQVIGARGVCRDVTHERWRDAELARAHNRDRMMNDIMRAISTVIDPGDLLLTAAHAIAVAFHAEGCQIFNRSYGDFTAAAQTGSIGDVSPALAALAQQDRFGGLADGRRLLGVVTRYRGTVNGAICLWRGLADVPWGEDDPALLDDAAGQVGIAHEQIANHQRILTLSRTDTLTGLLNRRAFFEEVARRFARLQRDNKSVALVYVDLDNFKAVNDIHGHKRGDEALLAVRDLLLRFSRPSDVIARLGGDEFVLWMDGTNEAVALRRCQDLLAHSVSLRGYSGSEQKPLTLSLGIAIHHPGQEESVADLLTRADQAMYMVKRQGKGGVRLADQDREGQ